MINVEDWKKIHKFQKKGAWCGPAVIQMALSVAGIEKKQENIAEDVYQSWWGTTQQIMIAYLSRFFKELNYIENASLDDVSSHLGKGHIVIVNWWDDLDKDDPPGGHYSIVGEYKPGVVTLVDPSNGREGVWNIAQAEFEKKWFDTLDVRDQIKINHWMLWIDPASKILGG